VNESAGRRDRWLIAIALSLAVAAAATYPITAAARLAHPYELEWLESEMLQHVVRVLDGESLHTQPTAEFAPTIYPPTYAWVSALFARLVGPRFLALRLVSVLSTLAMVVVAATVARKVGGDVRGGVIAAALVLAAHVPTGTMLDLGRIDALWVFLLLAATAVVADRETIARAVTGGLLLGAATATKQPAALFALVLALVLARRSLRAGITLAATWGLVTAAFYGGLHLATDGWSTIYLVLIPLRVPHLPAAFVHFVRDDLLRNFGPSIGLCLLWPLVRRADRPGGSIPLCWWAGLACAIAATTSMRTLQGGGLNTLVPLVVFGAVVTGAIAGRWLAHGPPMARTMVLLAVAIQFGMLLYDPRNLMPTPDDRRRAERFVAELQAIPGPVWVPSHTAFAVQAGKGFLVHRDPLLDLLYSGWDAFPEDLLEQLRAGRFAAVVTDGAFAEQRLEQALDAGYVQAREIIDPPRPLAGYRTTPRWLYVPRVQHDR